MSSLKVLCTPRKSVFDRDRSDIVLDLLDILEDRIPAEKFFEENFITSGMRLLLEKTFERLENSSDQASTFVLSQSMGGGKTHNMIALGLLAKYPEIRSKVLENGLGSNVGKVRVIGFSGRQSDAPYGIWGSLAEQLGKKELFNDLYSPLQAPGQSAWINLLKGEPTLILLDELPPYLNNARSKEIGNSDLSVVTTTAISNLLVAVNKAELSNVCIVISDLAASSYGDGSDSLNESLVNLQKETNRSALTIEPVSSQGDEVYHILKTRLFEKTPDKDTIKIIANEYADAVKQAKEMDVTNATPESYAAQIMESYPFHFSIRDLYARFKENPGFQQTRGLIRLMRIIVSSMYSNGRAEKSKLIHPYDIDLNDRELFSEIKSINPSLEEAISHDIANKGNSAAETMDKTNGSNEDAQDVSKLILIASLSNAVQATKGLSSSDIVGFLCAPGRDISRIKKEIIDQLEINLWYLHKSSDGKIFFQNTKNLAAELNGLAQSYTQESRIKELKTYLSTLFEPQQKDCYQKLLVMPSADEVELEQEKTTLIIAKPTTNDDLDHNWKEFFNATTFKNRVLFLTGRQETLNRVLENAAQYKAIQTIIETFEAEKRSQTDPQYKLANDNKDKILLQLRSSIQETFTTMFYPSYDRRRQEALLRSADIRIEFQQNRFNGEEHIKNTLQEKMKFTVDISSAEFRSKVETKLFGNQKTKSWNEVKRKSATDSGWDLYRPNALDSLKDQAIREGQWVDDGSGYINIEPPKPNTKVVVTELSRSDTGEATLRIRPDHGDIVYYEFSDTKPTSASSKVDDFQKFKTSELKVTFLCVDSKGEHETGEPFTWTNKITLKHEVYDNGKKVKIEVNPKATIYYTTDGTNPKSQGATYEDSISVPTEHRFVQVYAKKDGVESELLKIDVEPFRRGEVTIDKSKPTRWKHSFSLANTKDSYEFINRLKKFKAEAIGFRVTVQKDDKYLECQSDATMNINGVALEKIVTDFRSYIDGAEVLLDIDEVMFSQGQDLEDWAKDEILNLEIKEVIQ